ncbi:hypothetical protein D1B31_16190 [Neobacillus notoginsengisoli]|uniref:Uncharacterized protein n=1 Tax=Neobacillus notoginsengisoli TaxID=1578198 RepID=A0A417YR35_9BACI|nr:hypothetical protein [Neobacillus notoginsengisoli]RHW37305.1 hypothetical protein D1B31_16190 [Neobacillus notoginsengisoli]
MDYAIERAEPYVVKTEMLKNQTHQSFRWKEIALSNDKNILISMLQPYERVIQRYPLEVIKSHPKQY